MHTVKEESKNLIDNLPEQAAWDDIPYEFYVKKKISAELKAAKTVSDNSIISELKLIYISFGLIVNDS